MSNNVAGKVVVITGASSGLGEATARLLSAASATVVLGARRADRLQSLADELSGRGTKAMAVPTDVRKANQALVDLLGQIGQRKKATPAQIALAWLLAQKPWILPIPDTTKPHRLEENLGAAAVELTHDDLREIDSAASQIRVQGARYPEQMERMTGR